MSGAFGPLIAAGILSGMDGARGMAAWQWVSCSYTSFIHLCVTDEVR